ncbi:MAG TPA: hypothetical protein VLL75_18480 [Vicinamibacteria bacterium]|nr:hypothetical protein [Vicinamibacteria bacterium]
MAVVSSAHELYLRNEQELDRTLSVLLPFWVGAAVAAALALFLQRLERFDAARLALSSFYAAGLGFVVWVFLRALPVYAHLARWILDTAVGASLFAAAGLAATLALARRPGPRRIEPLLAVLAAVLVAREAAVLATRLDRRPPPPPPDLVAAIGPGGSPALPNVYHFLLDGLQDELVEPCWPAGGGDALDGFVRFRARAPVRSTLSVLPAIFSGRWLSEAPAPERLREALAGDSALLRDLKRAGYRTLAFVPRFAYEEEATAFDVTVFHDQNADGPDLAGLHAAAFLRLWVFVTLPRALSEILASGELLGVGDEFLGLVDVARLSSHAKPIVSRLSMERLIELEPRLAPRGRYTFVHLLLPHNPYVLRADCRHGGPAPAPVPTDLRQQTECALLLVHRFLDSLRRLGRLESSVVVVHGDHGSGEVLQGGRLVPEEDAWLRTALLLKPVGSRGGLRVAASRAALVDIAPTLLAMVGASGSAPRDGRVLSEALCR